MVNRISVVGALGLGLAILGVIARYQFCCCKHVHNVCHHQPKGGSCFRPSMKEPLRKTCGLGTRILRDIDSGRLIFIIRLASVKNLFRIQNLYKTYLQHNMIRVTNFGFKIKLFQKKVGWAGPQSNNIEENHHLQHH